MGRASLRIGGGAAIAAALLLLLVPHTRTEAVEWGLGWDPRHPFDAAEPFDVTITIDVDRGEIGSDLAGMTTTAADLKGLEFGLSGASGRGLVSIEAASPDGAVLISDRVGPNHGFEYPRTSPEPGFTVVLVEARAYPAFVPAPGGTVVVVVEAWNPGYNEGPIEITRLGVEPQAIDDLGAVDSGRSDACARLRFPIEVGRRGSVACTYAFDVDGRTGDRFETLPFVVALEEEGSWSAEPLWVEIVPAGSPPAAPPPDPVAGAPGDPAGFVPVRGRIVTGDAGTFRIRVTAPEGSPGFGLSLSATRRAGGLDWSGPGGGLGLGLAVAGIAALVASAAGPGVRRLGALALVAASLAVPVLLVVTGDHTWYWRPGAHLMWAPTLAVAACGGWALAGPPSRPAGTGRRVAAGLTIALAGFFTFVTVSLSWAWGEGMLGGEAPSSYSGDYMLMGVHVAALVVTIPLLILAGGLARWFTRPPGRNPAGPPAPPGSAPHARPASPAPPVGATRP